MNKELFEKKIKEIKKKIGKEMLSDEEITYLTAYEISLTYTYEEKKYNI